MSDIFPLSTQDLHMIKYLLNVGLGHALGSMNWSEEQQEHAIDLTRRFGTVLKTAQDACVGGENE